MDSENEERTKSPAFEIAADKKSETAVVIFSAAGAKSFHHYDTFNNIQTNKIFIKDPFTCYYNRGVPGLGESFHEVALSLKKIISELNCSKTVMFGTSMGSYAAILFGCLVHAEQVLVMGTRTFLNPEYISFNANIRNPGVFEYPDLFKIVKKNPSVQISSYCGEDNWLDVFHSMHLRRCPNVSLYSITHMSHNTLVFLKNNDLLGPFLNQFFWDARIKVIEDYTGEIFQDPLRLRYIWKIFPLIVEKRLEKAEKLLVKALKHRPEWAGAYYYLGEMLRASSRYEESETALRKAIELNPNFIAAYVCLGRTLDSQDRLKEAEKILLDAARLEPDDFGVSLNLGLALFRQNKLEQAENYLRKAVELESEKADAHYHLGHILFNQNRFEEAELYRMRSGEIDPVFAQSSYRKNRSGDARSPFTSDQ